MPTFVRGDGAPIVTFDPALEVSPFTVFRRLQEGRSMTLVDVRPEPGTRTLRGARAYPGTDWQPDEESSDVVLFDDDGSEALSVASRLRQAGFERVRALFGGLDLYEFSLDPRVVGDDTFLEIDESVGS